MSAADWRSTQTLEKESCGGWPCRALWAVGKSEHLYFAHRPTAILSDNGMWRGIRFAYAATRQSISTIVGGENMNGLQRRAYSYRAQQLQLLALRPLGEGQFGIVANYIDAALAVLRGDATPKHKFVLASPPLAGDLTIEPRRILRFTPISEESAVEWHVTPNSRPSLKKPDWDPGIRNLGINRWSRVSPTLKRRVLSCSDLEYDNYVQTELDRSVEIHCEQVNTGEITIGGCKISARIDRWVRHTDGSERAIEVKYLTDLHPTRKQYPDRIRQIMAELLFACAHGATFELATDRFIRQNPVLLENQKSLLPYGRTRGLDAGLESRIANFVSGKGASTIDEACASAGGTYRAEYTVKHMLFWGRLYADSLSTATLTMRTEVRIG